MRTVTAVLAVGVLAAGMVGCAGGGEATATVARAGNPVFPGWYADPEGVVIGGKVWVFPTYSDRYDKGKTVRIELPPEFLQEPEKHIFKIKRIQR